MSYRALDEGSNQGAQLFVKLGLKAGDHRVPAGENGLRFVEICWAAQRAGLIYTAISRYLKADEVAYIVRDCGAKVFVTSPPAPARRADSLGAPTRRRCSWAAAQPARLRDWDAESRSRGRRAVAERVRRPRHALFLRHDGTAEGRRDPADAGFRMERSIRC